MHSSRWQACSRSISSIEYPNDAQGQRVKKRVKYNNQDEEITYYLRDAQGTVLATYQQQVQAGQSTTYLAEQMIYGNERVGVRQQNLGSYAQAW